MTGGAFASPFLFKKGKITMNFYAFTAGDRTYNLVLDTKHLVALERRLGNNPINLLIKSDVPKIEDVITILHESMQQQNHGIKNDDMYPIIDAYFESGHDYGDLLNVMRKLFESAGLIEKESAEEEQDPNA